MTPRTRRSLTVAAMLAPGIGAIFLAVACSTAFPATSATAAPVSRSTIRSLETQGVWSPPVRLFADGVLGAGEPAVSCSSTLACTVVGTNVAVFGPSRWSSPLVFPDLQFFASVSCAASGPCEVAGPGVIRHGSFTPETYRLVNRKWTSTSHAGLTAISCASPNFCAAVDQSFSPTQASIFDGKSWSSPQAVGRSDGALLGGPDAISCPSATFCVAGNGSSVVYYKGGKWWTTGRIDNSTGRGIHQKGLNQFTAVSCATVTFCAAVDGLGNAFTYSSGTWSKPTSIDTIGLGAVSCPAMGVCLAADVSGRIFTYEGGKWSAPTTVASTVEFTSLSCPTTTFCVAVGSDGTDAYATTYHA